MADSVQAKARIQIDIDLDRDVLLATGIIGQETISRPYVYNLTLISKKFDIHPEQMLATKVGIRVRKEKEGEYRGLNGFVLSFAGGELHAKRREYRTYTMRVAPWLTLLDHGAEFRIFQDKNVLQIIDTVLKDAISGLHQATEPRSAQVPACIIRCERTRATDIRHWNTAFSTMRPTSILYRA